MRLHILSGMIDELEKIGVSMREAGFMQSRRGTRPLRVDTLVNRQSKISEPNTVSQSPELDQPTEPEVVGDQDEGDAAVGKTASRQEAERTVANMTPGELRRARAYMTKGDVYAPLEPGVGIEEGSPEAVENIAQLKKRVAARSRMPEILGALGAGGVGALYGATSPVRAARLPGAIIGGLGGALLGGGIGYLGGKEHAVRKAMAPLEHTVPIVRRHAMGRLRKEAASTSSNISAGAERAMHGFAEARPYVVGGLKAGVPLAVLGNIVGGRRAGAIAGGVGAGAGVMNEYLKGWAQKHKRKAVAKKLLEGQE